MLFQNVPIILLLFPQQPAAEYIVQCVHYCFGFFVLIIAGQIEKIRKACGTPLPYPLLPRVICYSVVKTLK